MNDEQRRDLLKRLAAVEIVPGTERYYGRMTLAETLSDALTRIEEWDYAEDAHGYCHTRSDWCALVAAILTREAA